MKNESLTRVKKIMNKTFSSNRCCIESEELGNFIRLMKMFSDLRCIESPPRKGKKGGLYPQNAKHSIPFA